MRTEPTPGGAGRWAVGCCCGPAGVAPDLLPHFDYLEVTLSAIEGEPPARPGPVPWLPSPLPTPVVMGMFPPGTVLFGPAADEEKILARAAFAVGLAAAAGATVMVFGAGAVRSIPKDVPRADGYATLARLLGRIGEIARAKGVRLALEPINSRATNVFTSVGETVGFLDDHGLNHLGFAYDLLQAHLEGEPVSDLARYARRLAHVHVPATEGDGGGPPPGALDDLSTALLGCDYSGRVSVEAANLAVGEPSVRTAGRVRSLSAARGG